VGQHRGTGKVAAPPRRLAAVLVTLGLVASGLGLPAWAVQPTSPPPAVDEQVPAPDAAVRDETASAAIVPEATVPDDADPADDRPDPAAERAAAEAAAEATRREAVAAAERRLADADAALARARVAAEQARAHGRAADGRVALAEAAIVPAVVMRRDAEAALTEAERAVRAAERQLQVARTEVTRLRGAIVEAERELDLARDRLTERLVRAYKDGSVAADAAVAITVVREARSPSEVATALKLLETAALASVAQVETAIDALAQLASELHAADADVTAAEVALGARRGDQADAAAAVLAAEADVEAAEEQAASRRLEADRVEEGVLAALGRALDAEVERAAVGVAVEAELAAAEDAYATALADAARIAGSATVSVDPPSDHSSDDTRAGEPGTRPDDGDAPSATAPLAPEREWDPTIGERVTEPADADADLEQRQRWLANRRGALEVARSIPQADRRAADDWVCPVEGSTFVNDWAFPRSQDRRHEGTDVFAPRGTEVRAPTDGVVVLLDPIDTYDGTTDLGGITITLERDRERFYLAHLEALDPELRPGDEVEAGQVVGWVGSSGNARGTPPHLHLGWYVEAAAVNPWTSLTLACGEDGGSPVARRTATAADGAGPRPV
jgi:peptidoglycan LD-endopeptidase LytH